MERDAYQNLVGRGRRNLSYEYFAVGASHVDLHESEPTLRQSGLKHMVLYPSGSSQILRLLRHILACMRSLLDDLKLL
jgi:hypothetical protein